MPKKETETKTEKKKVKESSFDLKKAINEIPNPFIRNGFKKFIEDEEVTSQKEFDNKYKLYMGDE